METTQKTTAQEIKEFFQSPFVKLAVMGFLILILLIPLSTIQDLIRERKVRQSTFQSQLNTEWGGQTNYYGMALRIPLKANRAKNVYIYPTNETDKLDANVTKKHRGIYTSQIYQTTIRSQAKFDWKNIQTKYVNELAFESAQICLVTDRNSRLTNLAPITVNGKTSEILGTFDFGSKRIFYAPIQADHDTSISAQSNISINGNSELTVHPVAAVHTMELKSNWMDPAFEGNLLPATTKFSKSAFTSTWKSLDVLTGKNTVHSSVFSSLSATVRFIEPVDFYQLNERTIKYGMLVVSLTFAVFFLIELSRKVSINTIHYVLVGMALMLFYLLLLSFSEQIGFTAAYIVAGLSVIGLIGWYARSILHSNRFASLVSVALVLLYTFLLVIVHLEVYALIAGSIGLLVVLFLIMNVTRKMSYTPTT